MRIAFEQRILLRDVAPEDKIKKNEDSGFSALRPGGWSISGITLVPPASLYELCSALSLDLSEGGQSFPIRGAVIL